MTSATRTAADRLVADLRTICGSRLRSVAVYGAHAGDDTHGPPAPAGGGALVHTLALIEALDAADLEGCARHARRWTAAGLATPLLLEPGELARSLDVFPIELGAILARHEVVAGAGDPFAGLAIRHEDLRRACEVQARSHLLHLREGFVESGGDPGRIVQLVADSAAPLRALLMNVARLAEGAGGRVEHVTAQMGGDGAVLESVLGSLGEAAAADGARIFPDYLAAIGRLVRLVDARS